MINYFCCIFTCNSKFLEFLRNMFRLQAYFCFLIFCFSNVQAQQNLFGRYKYRYELSYSIGGSIFLGDLGGANQIGTHAFKDIDYILTRPATGLGVRIITSKHSTAKFNLNYAIVRGDDKQTQEVFRNNRNLNFKSSIIELSAQFEINYAFEHAGHRYKIKRVKGRKNVDRRVYGFLGIGAFYFNPKGQYTNGTWHNLRDYRTEGQGLPGGVRPYSRISACFPIGIGGKYAFDRNWSIGMEIGLRYTLTDYIDDVSKIYATTNVDTTLNNPMATYFANPTINALGTYVTADGQQRGDPTHRDAYVFVTFSINYKLYKGFSKTRAKFK